MEKKQLEQFSKRLIEALLDHGERSSRQSKTGVTTKQLKEVAGVTNEMARRYTLGQAWPDPEKLARIAKWLNVREGWLRFGEPPKQLQQSTVEDAPNHYILPSLAGLSPEQKNLLRDSLVFAYSDLDDMKSLTGDFEADCEMIASTAVAIFNRSLRTDSAAADLPSRPAPKTKPKILDKGQSAS